MSNQWYRFDRPPGSTGARGILAPRTFGVHLAIGKLLGGWSIIELEVEKARVAEVRIAGLTAEQLRSRLLELADQLIASEAEGRFEDPLRPLAKNPDTHPPHAST